MKPTIGLYKNDRYLKQHEAKIIDIDGMNLILNETIFFPTGGGQACDRGSINGYEVVSVYEKGDFIYHEMKDVSMFETGDTVELQIDWEYRFENMQRHCGEHILSGKIFQVCSGVNKGFHMGEDYMTIDIDIPEISWETCMQAELLANEVIWKNEDIIYHHFDTKEEAENFPLRKALNIERDITIVSVGDLNNPSDSVACCGTHPEKAGEVGIIKIYKTEKNKNMTRIYFDAGKKAYCNFVKKQEVLNLLNARYSSDDSTLIEKIDIADGKKQEIKDELNAIKNNMIMEFCERVLREQETAGYSEIFDAPAIIKMINGFSSKSYEPLVRMLKKDMRAVLVVPVSEENTVLLYSNGKFDCGAYVKSNASLVECKGGGSPVNARMVFGDFEAMDRFIKSVIR